MDTKSEILKETEARKMILELEEKYQIDKVFEMIKNNYIDFSFKDKEYRIVLLSLKDKEEINSLRKKKFSQLLKDEDILFEADLKELYKKRGIDIDDIDKKINKLQNDLKEKNLKLGELLTHKTSEEIVLNTYRTEIKEITNQMQILTIQKLNALEYSLENQLLHYIDSLVAVYSCYKKEDEKYIRAFNNLEDFLQSEEEFITEVMKYSFALQNKL